MGNIVPEGLPGNIVPGPTWKHNTRGPTWKHSPGGPTKKLVTGPPRNLSQTRQETCYITNNTTNKLNYGAQK